VKLAACSHLILAPTRGTWFRAFDPQYMNTPLATAHTVNTPSRFSAGPNSNMPVELLYLSENQMVCLFEVEALFGSPKRKIVPNPSRSSAIINITVSLRQVADLTQLPEQRRLGVTAQELTGDWDGYHTRTPTSSVPAPTGAAPTQDLGEAMFGTPGIEGFKTVSAKVSDHMNLIIFPTKLFKGSFVEYAPPGKRKPFRIDGIL
jgi:hypothetical protein